MPGMIAGLKTGAKVMKIKAGMGFVFHCKLLILLGIMHCYSALF